MPKPLITIGIASFNAAESIKDSIYSALNQTWRPIEIVIVDDYSNDQTFEIIKNLALRNKEIRYFRNKNNYGIGFVRNKIIEESKGQFLAFFDDDDLSNRNRINIQYRRIIEYEMNYNSNKPIICHSSREVIYPNGRTRIRPTMGTRNDSPAPAGIEVAKRILLGKHLKDGYGSCPTCSQMARLKTYKNIGGFDSTFRRSEDTELCIRLSLNGAHFVGIKEPLVKQKMTFTVDKTKENEFKYYFLLLKKFKCFIDQYGNYLFCTKWLKVKYYFSKRYFLKMTFKLITLIIIFPLETLHRLIISLPSANVNIDFAFYHNIISNKKDDEL